MSHSKVNKNVPVKKKPAQEPSPNSKPSKNVPATPSKPDKKKSAQEPSPNSKLSKNVPSTPSKPDKKKPAQEPSPNSKLSKNVPSTLSKPDKKRPAQEPSPDSKLSKNVPSPLSEPVKKMRLKLRLKLGANKPSSPKPFHNILKTPSEAAPHTHTQDLPHQQSQVTTRSKSKAVKVAGSKLYIIPVDFSTILFIVFMTELLIPLVSFYDLCCFIYHTIYHFFH